MTLDQLAEEALSLCRHSLSLRPGNGVAATTAGTALVQLKRYAEAEQVLYQARIKLPSSVQTGTYTAETFAIRGGKVVTSAITRVEVKKQGFERFVAVAADEKGWLYGLFAVFVSVAMGWLAGRLFALV